MYPTNFPRSALEALGRVQHVKDVNAEPTPRERLSSALCVEMRRVAAETGRGHLFSEHELSTLARRIADAADCKEPDFNRLAFAGILLDQRGWSLVNDHLGANGQQPIAQAVIDSGCDPLQYGLATAMPKESIDNISGWARELRGKASERNGTLSLRSVLELRGGPEKLRQLSPVGWHALIGPNTEVVLPLFPDRSDHDARLPPGHADRNRNGRDAASVINTIQSCRTVRDRDLSVNISAGQGTDETHVVDEKGIQKKALVQSIDLSNLITPCPEVTIRVKEALRPDKVMIYAPEGVVVKVVGDIQPSASGAQSLKPINDIKLCRTTGNRGTELYIFDGRDPQRPGYVCTGGPMLPTSSMRTVPVAAAAPELPSAQVRDGLEEIFGGFESAPFADVLTTCRDWLPVVIDAIRNRPNFPETLKGCVRDAVQGWSTEKLEKLSALIALLPANPFLFHRRSDLFIIQEALREVEQSRASSNLPSAGSVQSVANVPVHTQSEPPVEHDERDEKDI